MSTLRPHNFLTAVERRCSSWQTNILTQSSVISLTSAKPSTTNDMTTAWPLAASIASDTTFIETSSTPNLATVDLTTSKLATVDLTTTAELTIMNSTEKAIMYTTFKRDYTSSSAIFSNPSTENEIFTNGKILFNVDIETASIGTVQFEVKTTEFTINLSMLAKIFLQTLILLKVVLKTPFVREFKRKTYNSTGPV